MTPAISVNDLPEAITFAITPPQGENAIAEMKLRYENSTLHLRDALVECRNAGEIPSMEEIGMEEDKIIFYSIETRLGTVEMLLSKQANSVNSHIFNTGCIQGSTRHICPETHILKEFNGDGAWHLDTAIGLCGVTDAILKKISDTTAMENAQKLVLQLQGWSILLTEALKLDRREADRLIVTAATPWVPAAILLQGDPGRGRDTRIDIPDNIPSPTMTGISFNDRANSVFLRPINAYRPPLDPIKRLRAIGAYDASLI